MMDISHDFDSAYSDISGALVNTIRAATRISAEDVGFHRSSSSTIARSLDIQNTRLLSLAEQLLRRGVPDFRASLKSFESLDSNWTSIVDAADSLLERSDTCLDEFGGRFRPSIANQSDLANSRPRVPRKTPVFRSHDIPKPQLQFKVPPDNQASPPFHPLLAEKPHARVTLEQSLTRYKDAEGHEHYGHPYGPEIIQYRYPPFVYAKMEPIAYTPLDQSQATFVDDYDGVLHMLAELKNAKEVAVDLEHHDSHSYIGIVCLMQISTRTHDWVIDTLKPWRRKLAVLNEVFTDPSILKVLHGAHMDIVWLQRDLGLYIVGLFDTHHASRALAYAGGSLAFLLKKFVDFDAQKQYQTADWRLRPIPVEMLEYAQSDTHFLLYIYDCMRNELVDRSNFHSEDEDLIQRVLGKSRETALQLYEHPQYDRHGFGRGGWFNLIQRNMSPLSKEQFAVFRAVHEWRDTIARLEDEGVAVVLPNHVLFNITRALPRDKASILALSHPISPILRLRADELLSLVQQTIATASNEPSLAEVMSRVINLHSTPVPTLAAISADGISTSSLNSGTVLGDLLQAEVLDIRSNTSSFWGPIMDNRDCSLLQSCDSGRGHGGMALPVPWYSGSISEFSNGGQRTSEGADTILASVQPIHASLSTSDPPTGTWSEGELDHVQESEVSQLLAESALPLVGGPDQLVGSDEFSTELAAKRVRQSLKKEARTVSKTGETQAPVADEKPSQPFDYGAAPSILHAASAGYIGQAGGFNPYAKASDAPSGLRRKQDARIGRTFTFRH